VSNYGGGLWEYDLNQLGAGGHPHWKRIGHPGGGNIWSVATISTLTGAVSAELLFALYTNGDVWNVTTGAQVSELSGIKQIYGAGDYLFAGNGSDVVSIDTSNTKVTLMSGVGTLMGAAKAGADYYVAAGNGIYSTTTPGTAITTPTPISGSGGAVMGIIGDGTDVAAAYDDSVRFFAGVRSGESIPYSGFSGAMTIWDDGTKRLLLGMMQKSSSFGYGYRETDWPVVPGGGISTPEPGAGAVTVTGSRFSAIGDHPVYGLYAVNPSYYTPPPTPPSPLLADANGRPVIFASTVKSGLWSYRTRRGEPQWNGEDNSD
jgi:hypothetical protein